MDKVISARIDETAADRIGALARRLRTSKKAVLEQAIAMLAAHVDQAGETDVFAQTSGAWSRKDSPARLVEQSRKAFRDSMEKRRQ